MVDKLKEHYKPTKSSTLAHYEFHTLKQLPSESFDTFINRVKHEANGYDFTCNSDSCNVKDTLIREQVIIGTYNKEIRKKALRHQWNLFDLTTKGRQLEAATHGADVIAAVGTTMDTSYGTNVDRIHHPGKYSKKKKARD